MRAWQRGGAGAWALSLVLGACNGKIDPTVASAGFREIPADQVIMGFQQYMTEAGRKKAVVLGDSAFVYNDSAFVRVKKVRLTMYDEKGQVSARLTSNDGDVNNATQAMIARGSVVLITNDGQHIETEELHYDPTTHRIWSNVPTVKRDPGGATMSGSGFEADDKFNNVRVTNARTTGGASRISF